MLFVYDWFKLSIRPHDDGELVTVLMIVDTSVNEKRSYNTFRQSSVALIC